jgi:hypothetical protein
MENLRVIATLADVPKEPVSQDPLGFGASAERLADVFAPGLTVSTRSVRYYQLLAAGTQLATEAGSPDTRAVTLRLERIWALASYLAEPNRGQSPGFGLAGIMRVRQAAKPHNQSQKLDYPMFQADGQARLGAWGLYRRSAEHLLLVDGVDPTQLGARLACVFLQNLDRCHLRKAALGKAKTAATRSLKEFGAGDGLVAGLDVGTAEAAWDALRNDPGRRAAAKAVRGAKDDQDELLQTLGALPQFAVPAVAARALEAAFAALTRVMDAAVTLSETAAVNPHDIRTSSTLIDTLRCWRGAANRRCTEMAEGGVDDAVVELARSVADATDPWEAVLLLVERHARVQEIKARQPWVEWHSGHLVRSAAAPNRGYDPFDPAGEPRGHDLRLRNLRDLARQIHTAKVKLN